MVTWQQSKFFAALFMILTATTLTACTRTAEGWLRFERLSNAPLPVTNNLQATISGAPSALSDATSLNVSIGGTDIIKYRYKVGLTSQTPCGSSAGYSASPLPIATILDASMATTDDGSLTLCVLGSDANGNEQTLSHATSYSWTKDAVASIGFSKLDTQVTESNTTVSLNFVSSFAKSYDTTISYTLAGDATSGLHYDLTAGNVVLPAGQRSVVKTFNIFNNTTVEKERRLSVTLSKTDQSKVILGSNADHTVDIRDDDSGTYQVVSSVSVNTGTNCLIFTSGALKCWGTNNSGSLGDGSGLDSPTPVAVDSGTSYAQVAVGGFTQNAPCAVTTAGVLKCWGDNSYGQIGDGTTTARTTPKIIDTGTAYASVATSFNNSRCAITTGGVLKCWGDNQYGQVGDGTTTLRLSPTIIDAGTLYASVAIGLYHTCAVTTGQVLKCWGSSPQGQLGDGTTTAHSTPTVVEAGTSYARLAVGAYSTCAVTTSGVLKCWGYNATGVIGDGTTTNRLSPLVVDAGTLYSFAALGASTTCASTVSGVLKCWGSNSNGQLGDGGSLSVYRLLPTVIDPGTSYTSLSIGSGLACGVTSSSILKCWGYYVQSNPYAAANEKSPVVVESGTTFTQVARGLIHSCAITSASRLKCWGSNTYGQLGDGTFFARTKAIEIDASNTYAYVAAGTTKTCGVTGSGVLKCWGYAGVGDGTAITRASPTVIDEGISYSRVAVGDNHVCAITASGVLKCWGNSNSSGQVGDGTTTQRLSPVVIDAGVTYSRIAAGSSNTCGVTVGKVLKCWGDNASKQVGDGTTTGRTSPVVIDTGVTYREVSLSRYVYQYYACGVTDAGVLKCWGGNIYGQLGDGSSTTRGTPTVINSGTLYRDVTAGSSSTCGVTTAGVAKCWGSNIGGQVGDGTQINRNTPVVVNSGTTYVAMDVVDSTACGLTTANVLKCWGVTYPGLFSRGDRSMVPTPVAHVCEP